MTATNPFSMNVLGVLVILAGLIVQSDARAADASIQRLTGRSEFIFEQGGKHVTVRYFVPKGFTPDSPVVFVMHGVMRNGESYLNDWIPYANERCFLLVVPEFSQQEFPGARGYQDGNMTARNGQPTQREAWTYNMIEPIFDAVRERCHSKCEQYCIYGHSAGAQFVHRFICFAPRTRVLRAISANAGSYMLPDAAKDFPYGFGGGGPGEAGLRAALGRPLIVLLGTADIDPHHKELPHSPEADAQGPYRLARGKFFFACGEKAAGAIKAPFGWTLSFAPGVAHSDKGMAPFAMKCLFPE
jgi:poly(3-hydroxybutyrate) depolymerase